MSSNISSNILVGTELKLRHVHHISQPEALENTWKETIEKELLHRGRTSRQLPSALMYDEAGLELWAKIVDLPDYYIPSAEMDSLSKWGQGVIEELGEGKALIDLGSGDIRKVIGLLGDFEKAKCRVYYFALDMNAEKLEESMRRIPSSWHHVQPYAICGTFEEARIWAQNLPMPKCFLSLGSTVGNDNPEYMAEELAQWSAALGPDDRMLIGLDSCQDEDLVLAAYNDNGDVWHDFIRNGFLHSNRVLGVDWFRPDDWKIFGTVDRQPFRHKFVAEARRPVRCPSLGLTFEAGDRIFTLESYKYELRDIINHFTAGGLEVRAMWRARAAPVFQDQYLLARHEPEAGIEESVINTSVDDRLVAPFGDNAVATTA